MRKASPDEMRLIRKIDTQTKRIKLLAIQREKLFQKLAKSTRRKQIQAGREVIQVARPPGKYVVFPEIGFVTRKNFVV